MIQSVKNAGPWRIQVTLADDRVQFVSVEGMEDCQNSSCDHLEDDVRVILEEYQDGKLIRREETGK